MPQKYRKRPVEVEAEQWLGDNEAVMVQWVGDRFEVLTEPDGENPDHTAALLVDANSVRVGIEAGEWIIRDSRGFYPCKADVFAETYEQVTADA